MKGRVSWIGLVLLVTACITVNKSVLSEAHRGQPLPKERVHVYFADDTIPQHERVAILSAKGDETFSNESQMIDKMRAEAGKLGANAIILREMKDPSTGAKVAAAIFGTSATRKGEALAIYVPALVR